MKLEEVQQRVIDLGAGAVAEMHRKVWVPNPGTGVPYRKTQKRRAIDLVRVEEYCRVLDSAFRLGTRAACHTRLCERAVELGLLTRDESAPGGYALATPEAELHGDLAKIPVK